MQSKKRALGRGLEALLPRRAEAPSPPTIPSPKLAAQPEAEASSTDAGTTAIAIDTIHPYQNQPRRHFDEDALNELANSIKLRGLLQPIALVPALDKSLPKGHYNIVAGERRWRAAKIAGLKEVPVIILENLSEQDILECALVENLQRENLTAWEEAQAYRSLIDVFGLTQEEVSERVGKSRPAVANTLRLLRLPEDLLKELEADRLSAGHARAILALEGASDQTRLWNSIVQDDLSVRQTENLASQMLAKKLARSGKTTGRPHSQDPRNENPEVKRLREQLIDALACRVVVKPSGQDRGKIEIYYDSLDELQRFLAKVRAED